MNETVVIIYPFAHFETHLSHYLKVYHPSDADDKLFLSERTDECYSLYTELIEEGVIQYAAYDLALKVLFDGL